MESSSSATPEKHTQRPTDRPKSQSVDVSNSSSTPGSNVQRGGAVPRSNTSTETSHSHNHTGHVAQATHTGHTSHPDLKRNSVYPYSSSSAEPARRRSRHESDNSRPLGHPSHRGEGELLLSIFVSYFEFICMNYFCFCLWFGNAVVVFVGWKAVSWLKCWQPASTFLWEKAVLKKTFFTMCVIVALA